MPEPGQKPGDLVGMGGVYNYANLAVYHYGGNNPLKYVDPTGEFVGTLSILAYSAAGLLVLVLANYASKNSDELAYAVEQAGNNASQSLQNTVDAIVAHAQKKPKENEADGAQTGEGTKTETDRPDVIDGGTDMTDTSTWPLPPDKTEDEVQEGEPSKNKPRSRGERSFYDNEGGEWRPHKPDKYHPDGHWNYKPPGQNAPWQEVPVD